LHAFAIFEENRVMVVSGIQLYELLMAEIEVKIAQSEARLTLRMFYFWLGQVAVIAGLLSRPSKSPFILL